MPTANDRPLPRLESVDEMDLKEECDSCNGRGIIPSEKVVLKSICRKCGGEGKRFWVDKIMQSRTTMPPETRYKIAQENIHFLIQVIREQGAQIGVDVQVDIRYKDYMYEYNKYRISPPMFKIRDIDSRLSDEITKGGKF